ncbi:MAG TPA: helix-turn-helix transcriptional regulator [Cyclobacteriaceae bacterium]|nr:helix-turn-helix transcriptional regulator [Cyclobacteriaceae bacterium]HRK54995.1 helix-turn-helix transcriptional regulator [Cyclobacteriaceae bacterium]
MKRFEDIIRKEREALGVPLRTVAAFLDIDQAILSKMERGQKTATRKQVILLAKYYKLNEKDLIIAWLSGKLVDEIGDEPVGLEALQVAEEQIKYGAKTKS